MFKVAEIIIIILYYFFTLYWYQFPDKIFVSVSPKRTGLVP